MDHEIQLALDLYLSGMESPDQFYDRIRAIFEPPVEGRGPWLQLRSGKAFYPWDPRSEDFELEDIAEGLAKECRYNGQCKGFWSVAQHSMAVVAEVENKTECLPEVKGRENQLSLLAHTHDAEEALTKDIPAPMKELLGRRYKIIQERVRQAINKKFGMDKMVENCSDLLHHIKRADIAVLLAEKRAMMRPAPMIWGAEKLGIEPSGVAIRPRSMESSYLHWLENFHHYWERARREVGRG
jgi:5'-deoxynucleotidase YfbR-like HD superfamily hydrolase